MATLRSDIGYLDGCRFRVIEHEGQPVRVYDDADTALRLIALFYFLSFTGHLFVGWYRGTGRMNITFYGTTLQIIIRVAGTYLLIDAMGLDAVALATGLGWIGVVAFWSVLVKIRRVIAPL